MIVYHGTTHRRAARICEHGFLPRRPSRRVWFAKGHGYALRRARQQARRARQRPVVLTCDINLGQLRKKLGKKKVFCRGGVIAIGAPVPADVLRSHTRWVDQPSSPEELSAWLNNVLRLKAYKGISARHPGVERLSRWVVNRLTSQPRARLKAGEMIQMARQWLPEFFDGVVVDSERLHAYYMVSSAAVRAAEPEPEPDPREDAALELLESTKPTQRARGLELLAELDDPDLFDWCAMFLADRSVNVRVAALHLMRRCEEGDAETVQPLARSENKRIRAAALGALVRLSGEGALRWLKRGLKDPEPCVRREAAGLLRHFDPSEHRAIFELALCDPNPDVAHVARKLTQGKGYPRSGWPAPAASTPSSG